MLKFNIGDLVSFEADGLKINGIITRFNKKTVSIVTTAGSRWNVYPGILRGQRDLVPVLIENFTSVFY